MRFSSSALPDNFSVGFAAIFNSVRKFTTLQPEQQSSRTLSTAAAENNFLWTSCRLVRQWRSASVEKLFLKQINSDVCATFDLRRYLVTWLLWWTPRLYRTNQSIFLSTTKSAKSRVNDRTYTENIRLPRHAWPSSWCLTVAVGGVSVNAAG